MEKYRVYNLKHELLGEIEKEQEKKLKQQYYLEGVTCFVINSKGEVLIEKRADSKELMPNELDLCSGHVISGETSREAMVREYVEELHNGTDIERSQAIEEGNLGLKYISELDLEFNNRGKQRNFFISFYALITENKNITIQKEELSNYYWVPMDKAFELIRKKESKFPYDYRVEGIFSSVKKVYENYIKKEKEELEYME